MRCLLGSGREAQGRRQRESDGARLRRGSRLRSTDRTEAGRDEAPQRETDAIDSTFASHHLLCGIDTISE
jgi:hypothetical protein